MPADRTAGRRRLRIGIDTGGTFTDVVALDEVTGTLTVTKTPSTPADPAQGFMTGLTKILRLLAAGPAEIASISHGTTIATNQLLAGDVGELGFVTSDGFQLMLEIARQSVPDGYGNSYFWVKPDRIVPPDRVKTVGGRLDHTGAELRPFDEANATAVARWFRDRAINTLGVCFLHSYANPEHEERMAKVLASEHPGAVVSLSSQVLPEYREYERSMTTLIDAAVKPRMSQYLSAIAQRLAGLRAEPVPLHVMTSNGGVATATEIIGRPITTVLSGPAAGAVGAAMIAQSAGITSVLTCDGGGTSTDVAVVVGGEPALTTEGCVGAYPSKIPMVDVVTVGAGGGSVAWVSPEGSLKVGPQSAGADPGPLCYARGGRDVTVTDAHLLLGRIPPHLLGGEIPLDADAARAGIADLAAKLGMPDTQCAAGILEVSAWNQANAVRQITVKRGLDLRDFTLVTFGGSGSLLACPLIEILGVRGVLVPSNPGNISAFGLLTVDVRADYVRTCVARQSELDYASMEASYAGLAARAHDALTAQGFAAGDHQLIRSADLRYFGQAFEVRVPVAAGQVGPELTEAAAADFHAAHRALYGYDFRADPRQQVEWVNLRVTGIGPIQRPRLAALAARDGDAGRAVTGRRPVVFARAGGPVDTPIHWRPELAAGDEVAGPAIIEEYGATVPVHPGFVARVDGFGNLLLGLERNR
ncbi:MAG TPA: hydantoinase/oxoprolinase family protein [Streptosporangiaceae bacterium]